MRFPVNEETFEPVPNAIISIIDMLASQTGIHRSSEDSVAEDYTSENIISR